MRVPSSSLPSKLTSAVTGCAQRIIHILAVAFFSIKHDEIPDSSTIDDLNVMRWVYRPISLRFRNSPRELMRPSGYLHYGCGTPGQSLLKLG